MSENSIQIKIEVKCLSCLKTLEIEEKDFDFDTLSIGVKPHKCEKRENHVGQKKGV